MAENLYGDESSILLVKKIWKHVSSAGKRGIFFLIPLAVISSFAELLSLAAFPVFLGVLISPDSLSATPFLDYLLVFVSEVWGVSKVVFFGTLFCVTVILAGICRYALVYVNTKIFTKIGNELAVKLYSIVINKPYRFFLDVNSSEVHALMYKVNNLASSALEPFFSSIVAILLGAFLLVGLLYIDPVITVASIISVGAIYALILVSIRRMIGSNSVSIARHRGPLTRVIQESFGGIRDVILAGTHEVCSDEYRKNVVAIQNAEASNRIYGAAPRVLIEAFGVLVLSVLALVFHSSSQQNFSSIVPVLAAVALGFHKILPLAQQVYANALVLKGAKNSIIDCLNVFESDGFAPSKARLFSKFQNGIDRIEFVDVGFRYFSNTSMVLERVNFMIKSGETVGLIGESGSGKSTLLDIFMGFLTPCNGVMLVNGTAIDENNLSGWYEQVSHVPQSIFLIDASVTENIAFGVAPGKVDHDRLNEVLKMTCLFDAVENLPYGLDTKLGERGVNLSGGQRQRIGIARALYRGTKVLVLDEATSALDTTTEATLIHNLKSIQKDMIVFIVSHRNSSLKNCTSIYEIKEQTLRKLSSQNASSIIQSTD